MPPVSDEQHKIHNSNKVASPRLQTNGKVKAGLGPAIQIIIVIILPVRRQAITLPTSEDAEEHLYYR